MTSHTKTAGTVLYMTASFVLHLTLRNIEFRSAISNFLSTSGSSGPRSRKTSRPFLCLFFVRIPSASLNFVENTNVCVFHRFESNFQVVEDARFSAVSRFHRFHDSLHTVHHRITSVAASIIIEHSQNELAWTLEAIA